MCVRDPGAAAGQPVERDDPGMIGAGIELTAHTTDIDRPTQVREVESVDPLHSLHEPREALELGPLGVGGGDRNVDGLGDRTHATNPFRGAATEKRYAAISAIPLPAGKFAGRATAVPDDVTVAASVAGNTVTTILTVDSLVTDRRLPRRPVHRVHRRTVARPEPASGRSRRSEQPVHSSEHSDAARPDRRRFQTGGTTSTGYASTTTQTRTGARRRGSPPDSRPRSRSRSPCRAMLRHAQARRACSVPSGGFDGIATDRASATKESSSRPACDYDRPALA